MRSSINACQERAIRCQARLSTYRPAGTAERNSQATFVFFVVLEHIALIGGLMVAAALGARDARPASQQRPDRA